jgi:hypothetical protein
MGRQGCVLQDFEIRRILSLLASTHMTIPEIAERLGCSRSAIVSINRKFKVRDYGGHRSTWVVSAAYRSDSEANA